MPTVPKTFFSLQAVGRMMKIPADTIKDAYRGKELSSIRAIAPIAHLFKRFEEGDEFSYAILKSHFERWRNTGKVPKVSAGRPKTKPENCENWNDWIPKELAIAFKQVVDNANRLAPHNHISYRQARFIAYQEFIERRPMLRGGGDDGR
jgi:hypothetical protein